MMKVDATLGHVPHKIRLLLDQMIHHMLSYFGGNAMNSKNKLWVALAIKNIDTSPLREQGFSAPITARGQRGNKGNNP